MLVGLTGLTCEDAGLDSPMVDDPAAAAAPFVERRPCAAGGGGGCGGGGSAASCLLNGAAASCPNVYVALQDVQFMAEHTRREQYTIRVRCWRRLVEDGGGAVALGNDGSLLGLCKRKRQPGVAILNLETQSAASSLT